MLTGPGARFTSRDRGRRIDGGPGLAPLRHDPGVTAPVIDLNADLGEGLGIWRLTDDDGLLGVITSANVACGFHGGDPSIMRRVCAAAVDRGVRIGAQVGYRDLHGFGRRFLDVAPLELTDDVLYQLGALDAFARVAGDRVRYLKPHGALYNAIVRHESQAAAVVEAVRRYDASLPVLGLPGSAWLRLAAEAGLTAVPEAFADRAYTPTGELVSRREPGAVLADPDDISARSVRMAVSGQLVASDGSIVDVTPRSLCVHGDSPGAVTVARRVRAALHDAGVDVQPFTTGP
ncbi:MAG: LamB/YcsF family protein [Geodermatophilaceae bacterium]|nr:LamB/YcsF family protein [Geodermatophilaceae bacterium]